MRSDFQSDATARHRAENFPQCFRCRAHELLRSPKSRPMVSFGWKIFLLCLVAAVQTFFIAGLLYLCALSTSITWERTPHPVRRPAFSSHLVKQSDGTVLIFNSAWHKSRGKPAISAPRLLSLTNCA